MTEGGGLQRGRVIPVQLYADSVWISREAYEKLVRGNDQRDLLAIRAEMQALRSDFDEVRKAVNALRSYTQRRFERTVDDEAPVDASVSRINGVVDDVWYARPAGSGGT